MILFKAAIVLFIVFYFRCHIVKSLIGQKQPSQLEQLNQRATAAVRAAHAKPSSMKSLELGTDVYTSQQLGHIDKYLYDENLQYNTTLDEFFHWSVSSKFHAYTYNDLYTHRYDDYNDLRMASDPGTVNQELCLTQLGQLLERAGRQKREKFNSMDLLIYQLLDTFGRPSVNQMKGNSLLLGSYNGCRELHMDLNPKGPKESLNYCLASLKLNAWDEKSLAQSVANAEIFDDIVAIKVGVCLPKSCDSMNYKNKFSLVEKLIDYNARDVDKNQAKVIKLYCLPGENSPLRDWKQSAKSVLAVAFFSSWILLLAYSTIRTSFFSENKQASAADKSGPQRPRSIFQLLSVVHNFNALVNLSERQQVINIAKEGEPEMILDKPVVDLRPLDGIKVLSMFYIIMGHVLMCLTTVLENGRDMGSTWSPPYHLSNMIPAFAVNSFFAITGTLTAYYMFKQNERHKFILRPAKWLAIIIQRYLRIMPVYLVVVLYAKTLAKYASSGPLWDYATSALSQRRNCEHEPWSLTLLFKANTRSPLEQCIPSAWYLANDFQFMLVTPIFVGLLFKYPKFGQPLLKACAFLGFVAGIVNIYLSKLDDLTPIANFDPHGFKTYVSFLHSNYVGFSYRLPAYLIGLLFGYSLYKYEKQMLDYLRFQRLKELDERNLLSSEDGQLESLVQEPKHSEFLIRHITKLSLFVICLVSATPFLARFIPFNEFYARIMVSLFIPSYHILYALAVGGYILLASTGHGNERLNGLLSSPRWKPLARISLCVVLVNVEVMNYIIQGSTKMWYVDSTFHTCLNIICIFAVYATAALVYILFEAPLKSMVSYGFERLINRMAIKQKVQ